MLVSIHIGVGLEVHYQPLAVFLKRKIDDAFDDPDAIGESDWSRNPPRPAGALPVCRLAITVSDSFSHIL